MFKKLIILFSSIIFLGCCETNCEFRPGQLVRSKINGEIGQVIYLWCNCLVDVRFSGSQEFTNSRVLSDDGAIENKPLAIVYEMRPYELEHVEN